jgi:hypothetical protein
MYFEQLLSSLSTVKLSKLELAPTMSMVGVLPLSQDQLELQLGQNLSQ